MNSGDNNVIFGRRENNNLEEEKRKKKTRAEQVVNAADWRLFLALYFWRRDAAVVVSRVCSCSMRITTSIMGVIATDRGWIMVHRVCH